MTKFERPAASDCTDAILKAWQQADDKIPSSSQYSMSGHWWLPGSLIVLKWILDGQEKAVLDRLRSSTDPRCRTVLDKLKALAKAGVKDLESGAIRHGQGVGIAKVKASFDPDRWT